MPFFVARINLTKIIYKAVQFCDIFFHACVCYFLLKKSFITGTSTLQPLYLLYIHAILIPNWGNILRDIEKANDDGIDALRYAEEQTMKKKTVDYSKWKEENMNTVTEYLIQPRNRFI